ncbi:MAG: acylneuraminate cytidylyltransferase family protein [Lentisphaerae bacterium]|nr:acylneuraminate cytidylyltransferase family protein [Lentisphaerota bacterium]
MRRVKTLGVITARGGSRGIPDKNIVPLCGKPLIAYTIESARAAARLDRCIVSTDSEKIAAVCRDCGADVPFLRPAGLARDDSRSIDAVLHALDAVETAYDAVMVLQPTSPLRTAADIDAAVALLEAHPDADAVISVVDVDDHHPARMKRIEAGFLVDPPFAEAVENQPRQELPRLYLRNGAVYLTRVPVLRETRLFKGRRCLAYEMPAERSVNIDSLLQLHVAEALLRGGPAAGPGEA